jgi:hypothetical protein
MEEMMEPEDFTIVPLPFWFVLLIAALFSCAGCSSNRYLTEEQDAELRAGCEEHGCTIIPNPIWFQIREILKRHGAV